MDNSIDQTCHCFDGTAVRNAHIIGCPFYYATAPLHFADHLLWALNRLVDEYGRAEVRRALDHLGRECRCGHDPMLPSGAHVEGCPRGTT